MPHVMMGSLYDCAYKEYSYKIYEYNKQTEHVTLSIWFQLRPMETEVSKLQAGDSHIIQS